MSTTVDGLRFSGAVDQEAMRRKNLSVVLHRISGLGRTSRAALAADIGLTKPAVSALVADLVERGLVRHVGMQSSLGVGRPASMLEIDGRGLACAAVEINVGFVTVTIRDLGLRECFRERRSFRLTAEPEEVLALVVDLLGRARELSERDGRRMVGLVLAVPALLNSERGFVVNAPRLGWRNVAVRDWLVARLAWPDVPVIVDNIANFAALGESRLPTYRSATSLVHLEVGAGVGAGIVLGGEVQRGGAGFAGVIGHTPLDTKGRCGCGRTGCLEALAGLPALLERALPDCAGTDEELDGGDPGRFIRELVARAEAGDATALDGIAETGRWLARGAAIAVNLLDPDVLTLGGYVAPLRRWILDPLITELAAHVVAPDLAGCRVTVSELGRDAALYGAAVLGQDTIFADPTAVK